MKFGIPGITIQEQAAMIQEYAYMYLLAMFQFVFSNFHMTRRIFNIC